MDFITDEKTKQQQHSYNLRSSKKYPTTINNSNVKDIEYSKKTHSKYISDEDDYSEYIGDSSSEESEDEYYDVDDGMSV